MFLLTSICWLLIIGESSAEEALNWEIGDSWKTGITLYSRDWMLCFSDPKIEAKKHEPTVLGRYIVEIKVTGMEMIDNVNCWQLDFVPEDLAPEGIRKQRYRILVSQEDNNIRTCRRLVEGNEIKSENVYMPEEDGIKLMPLETYGFPLEILLYAGQTNSDPNSQEGQKKLSKLIVNRIEKSERGAKHIDSIVTQDSQELARVIQIWPAASKWWAKYVKYTEGHVEMEASVMCPWLSNDFNRLYEDWRGLVSENKFESAKKEYDRIIGLGIATVPYIIEKIKLGDITLIPVISEFNSGVLEKTASQKKCLDWWEKNKERWNVPSEK